MFYLHFYQKLYHAFYHVIFHVFDFLPYFRSYFLCGLVIYVQFVLQILFLHFLYLAWNYLLILYRNHD